MVCVLFFYCDAGFVFVCMQDEHVHAACKVSPSLWLQMLPYCRQQRTYALHLALSPAMRALDPRSNSTVSADPRQLHHVMVRGLHALGWQQLRAARGGALNVIFDEATHRPTEDVVHVREDSLLSGIVGAATPAPSPSVPTLDLRALRLRGLFMESAYLQHVSFYAGGQTSSMFTDTASSCDVAVLRATTQSLETLSLCNVTFSFASQSIPTLAQCSSLRRLSLRRCRGLTGWQQLAGLPHLVLLDFCDCQLHLDLGVFRTCTSLQHVNVSGNRAHGFHMLPQLVTLNASRCELEDVTQIKHCTELQRLYLAGNHVERSGFVSALTELTRLQLLDVDRCGRLQLEDLTRALTAAPLASLVLGSSELDGWSAVSNAQHLQRLTVHAGGCMLRNLAVLTVPPCLKELVVIDADLFATGLGRWLAAAPCLTKLVLRRCRLASVDGIQFASSSLAVLDLEGNYFSGSDADPHLDLLLYPLQCGLRCLSLKAACMEDLDWVTSTQAAFDSGARFGGLVLFDMSDNSNVTSCHEGEVFRRFPNLETLYLAPTFPFDLLTIRDRCPRLRELHHAHPCVMPQAEDTHIAAFPALEMVSMHENELVHGASLTYRFLSKLPKLMPGVSRIVFAASRISDEHIKSLSSMMGVRHVTVVATASWAATADVLLWKLFPALQSFTVVHNNVKSVERQASEWIRLMPATCLLRLQASCDVWESQPF